MASMDYENENGARYDGMSSSFHLPEICARSCRIEELHADTNFVAQTRLPVMSVIVAPLLVQPVAMTAPVVVPVALHLPTVMVMSTAGQYPHLRLRNTFSNIYQWSSQE
jgi:hypothetical protein